MSDDWLGFEDPAERNAALGPALMLPAKMGPRELIVTEQMHRKDDDPAANRICFVTVDEATGAEVLEEPDVWKAIMGWPVTPEIEQVSSFQISTRIARLAAWWSRLAAARAEDDAVLPKTGSQP